MDIELTVGEGRGQIHLQAFYLGQDLVAHIFNEGAHLGAVAVGEYDKEHSRVSVSVMTRLGHKDDTIAQTAAYLISQSTLKPSCVIAGVHLDNITEDEINRIIQNTNIIVQEFIDKLRTSS